MTGLVVREVDPGDEAAAVAWLDVTGAAARHEVGDHAPLWSLPELLPMLREPDRTRRLLLFNGVIDGEVVATGRLALRLLDNTDAAEVEVHVRPDVRRRGLGTRMLAALEQVAAADGRRRFEGQACWAYDGPADGAGATGVEFACSQGYAVGIVDVQRELPLPVDDARLSALAAQAAPYHSDYALRSWSGPVPDDLVVGWLELANSLMTEAPAGEMERQAEAVDVEAHRLMESIQARQGRTLWHAVALDAAGTVVAYSQLVVPPAGSHHVFQWGTLVRRDHRGHRLGLAVKVANLQAMQRGDEVTGRRVVTWNAAVNGPMIAINEQLGFVAAARTCELQKRIG